MKKIILGVCLFCFHHAVWAGFAEGEQALNEQKYAVAFSEFQSEADAGDFRSQYYLGYLYLNGLGVAQNDKKALEYLQKAVNQDFALAQATMAYLYSEGKIVPKDKKMAIDLYTKSAEQGNSSAFLNLGIAYYLGDGVDKDIKKAITYLENISLSEKPIAGRYLGDIYSTEGQTLDHEKAINYYTTAAGAGDLVSYYMLGQMYQKGLGVPEDIDKALLYFSYAASQGYAPAQYVLGIIYANGEGVKSNRVDGYAWLYLASSQQLDIATKTMETLSKNMSLSEIDHARRRSIEIQQTVMGKQQPPIQVVTDDPSANSAVQNAKVIIKGGRRRRRR